MSVQDQSTLPALSADLPPFPVDQLRVTDKALAFVRKYRLEPGAVFWVVDGDTRAKATLSRSETDPPTWSARVHWATMEDVVPGRA